MENEQDKGNPKRTTESGKDLGNWLKVSAIAAASAFAGGIAAVWLYRTTLQRLQNAEPDAGNTNFGISEDDE